MSLKVLVACEESQTVCKAFRDRGFEAYSCDLQSPSGSHPEWHIQGDCLPLLNGTCTFETLDGVRHSIETPWNLIIAHPPCTYLSNAGNAAFSIEKYGEKAKERWSKRFEAMDFAKRFHNTNCKFVVIENPIGYLNSHWKKPSQIIHPWQYGHEVTKPTCLWIKGVLPLLCPTNVVGKGERSYWKSKVDGSLHYGGSKWYVHSSAKERSKTFQGIAEAMAEQWGEYIKQEAEHGNQKD